MGDERCGLELVGDRSLLKTHTAEGNFLALDLGNEGCPHLKNSISESELKDSAGDGGDHGLVADAETAPCLLLIPALRVEERAGVVGREFCRCLDAVNLESPFVGRAGRGGGFRTSSGRLSRLYP